MPLIFKPNSYTDGFTASMSNVVFVLAAFVFLFGSILAIFFVAVFEWFFAQLHRLISAVGIVVLRAALVLIYALLMVPIGQLMYKRSPIGRYINYRLSNKKSLSSSFVKPVFVSNRDTFDSGQSVWDKFFLLKLINFVVKARMYPLIPVLLLIVLLAMVFAFVSSPIVAPFIYTIF